MRGEVYVGRLFFGNQETGKGIVYQIMTLFSYYYCIRSNAILWFEYFILPRYHGYIVG